jgi:hypothetical protein
MNEIWRSTHVNIVLQTIADDPRYGHTTMEVKGINCGEPDPSLFRAPKGYAVKEQQPQQ